MLNAYLDTGNVPTIGYGTTQYPNGRKVKTGDSISQAEADLLLEYGLIKFTQIVLRKIKIDLQQYELDALVDFCYNAGTSYKSAGKWRDYNIWNLVNKREITPEYWRNLAITDNGKKLPGLVKRRHSESDLFFTGDLRVY